MMAETKTQSTLKLNQSIRSMFVLYGSVRSTPLAQRIDRNLLDLPLVSGTIANHHLSNAKACARRFGLTDFEMRVLTDTESYSMEQWADNDPSQSTRESVRCVIQQDASPIRGVAGVLADATTEMADDDYIIVTSGAQVFLEPLDDLVYAMAKKNADVAFVSSKDGAPVGLWLIRCGVLRSVNSIGYVDLKEQALDEWKQNHKVCVVERPRAYAHPTRSLVEYLGAIRADVVGVRSGSTIDQDPYREDWESTFSIIEPRAQVNEAALLHDSIALQNSSVGKGAVVVRSVICPGATVSPGARVHDMVVTGVIKKERGR